MSKVRKIITQILRRPLLVVYPLTLLFTNAFRFIQAYVNVIRALLMSGDTSYYVHFNMHKSLNMLFYWNRALNIWRFGRAGKSPYLGLGDYTLARCFHYTLPSFYAFWKASIPTLFICGNLWLFSFMAWQSEVDLLWLSIVVGLTAISTLFYTNVFNLQNYNLVGWVFFPISLYALQTENWILLAFGGLGMIILSLLLGVMSLVQWSIYPALCAIPGAISLSLNLIPLLKLSNSGASGVLISVMKAIGMTSKKAVYVRQVRGKKLNLQDTYYLVLLIQFAVVSYLMTQQIEPYLLFVIFIYLLNGLVIRFADTQSIQMMVLSVAVVVQLNNPDWIMLCSFWLLVSPIPSLSGYYYDTTVVDVLPRVRPVNMKPIFDDMDAFLSPIPEEQKVYMAFENPNGVYEAVFDGYRQLIELPAYRASVKKILFFPEWWGVFELNYEGAPEIWGRDVDQVKQNTAYWKSDYVIVYQKSMAELDDKWRKAGFTLLKTFDWTKYSKDFEGHKYFDNLNLTWFLLKQEGTEDSDENSAIEDTNRLT
jgi:hypothetical protein